VDAQNNDFHDNEFLRQEDTEEPTLGQIQLSEVTSEVAIEEEEKDHAAVNTIPAKKPAKGYKKFGAMLVIVIICVLVYGESRRFFELSPPGENVVATYNGKSMTIDEMMEHILLEGVREGEHMICEKHGFDHSQCDTLEECETHPLHSLEAYQRIVEMLAYRKIIEDWANANGVAEREDIRHGLQDIAKEMSAANSIIQVHDKELSSTSIGKWEVQKYFDENKARYQDTTFSEAESEIRNILAEEKQKTFFPEYIEKLKQDAGVSLNLEILKIDAPTEAEMREYYARNSPLYTDAESGKTKNFSEVRDEIKQILQKQKNDAHYDLNGGQTLFTIHDRRYTVRDFTREFYELAPEYQTAFADYESKRKLVEQLLVKELLAEANDDMTEDVKERHYFEDMRTAYFRQVLHKEEIDEKLKEPANDEVEEFYEENKVRFVLPAQVKMSFISVSQGLNGEKREQAQAKIREAMEAIQNGADFAETAKQYSEAPVSRVDQWVHENDLNELLAKNVFALRPNETSDVFETQGIFFIVKVDDRQEAREQSFEEVEAAIKNYLLREKHIEAEVRMERELLDKAQLVVYQKTLRKLLQENVAKAVNK
jgi:parvulin-like peptidyl-prolyl isomerase